MCDDGWRFIRNRKDRTHVDLAKHVGVFACGVGVIFTFPLLFVVPALVYRDFTPTRPVTMSTEVSP